MKVVIAYVETGVFDALRGELLRLGFRAFSAWEASGSVPDAGPAAQYRGVEMERRLRSKMRLECVVGAEQVATVVDAVLEFGGDRKFVFVVPVEAAFPTDSVVTEALVESTG
jgi:nitrogen regulatory protein PII